jgi:hypothetical protein
MYHTFNSSRAYEIDFSGVRDALKNQLFGSEDRTFNASPAIIPRAIRLDNFCHTTKAGPEATGHRRFQRKPTRNSSSFTNLSDSLHHGFRATAVNVNTF